MADSEGSARPRVHAGNDADIRTAKSAGFNAYQCFAWPGLAQRNINRFNPVRT
jgi:hypothetical protein